MSGITKRKKTADMPNSPPKRVTRARAKASHDDSTQPETVKVTASSSRATAEKAGPVNITQGSKRRTRADNTRNEPSEEKEPAEATKTRGRAKKLDQVDGSKSEMIEVPKKTRGRQPKAQTLRKEVESSDVKSHAKLKKATNLQDEAESNATRVEELTNAKPTVRTRAAVARTKVAAPSRPPKSSMANKKVKFQDDVDKDKENMPVELENTTSRATGLIIKPIRKPTTTRAIIRGRKVAPSKTGPKTDLSGNHVSPLSPKKIGQVAKSNSNGSEDELCGENTPLKILSHSPIRPPPSSIRRCDGTAPDCEFNTTTASSSPPKCSTTNILQSPARRPPPSPFKDALRKSPKKGSLGNTVPRPSLAATQSPARSTMKGSPKRGLAPTSVVKPIMFAQRPLKASLLQSPARRPTGSPIRNALLTSPSRRGYVSAHLEENKPSSPPEVACSSPLRTARTPDQAFKVHKISATGDNVVPETTSPDPISHEAANEFAEVHRRSSMAPVFTYEIAEEAYQAGPYSENILTASDAKPESTYKKQSSYPHDARPLEAPAFSLASPVFRFSVEESDSEDELASPQKVYLSTPLSRNEVSADDFALTGADSSVGSRKKTTWSSRAKRSPTTMTPLAAQMSAWLASSPERKLPTAAFQSADNVFSSVEAATQESPPKASFFDDEMAVLHSKDETMPDVQMKEDEQNLLLLRTSHDSQASEEYGDENQVPAIEPNLVQENMVSQDQSMTCTPAKVFSMHSREIHTVCKVPLRPAADELLSPLKVPRKRSRSLAGSSSQTIRSQEPHRSISPMLRQAQISDGALSGHGGCATPVMHRCSNDDSLIVGTPRTLRKSKFSNVLKGAVIFVDVHTTEGEDASGIFLELLTQMGARCVKQWSWNPRDSMSNVAHSPEGGTNEIDEVESSNNKIGITHVVYKDGGKRTMEKVRASKGVVHCVGVGWVLDCEREDRWLDEAEYAIDNSTVPRGGHRRRKSMEPRMLANMNGNLIPAQTPVKPAAELSPTKEFLTFDTPASRRESFAIPALVPATPVVPSNDDDFAKSPLSPTTPYYLSKGAQLVQQTCPPKQTQELLFPISGRIEDQPDEVVRQRLLVARRKSLQWVPKVSSPLGRAVSYGK